jgi:hypothetical protein
LGLINKLGRSWRVCRVADSADDDLLRYLLGVNLIVVNEAL